MNNSNFSFLVISNVAIPILIFMIFAEHTFLTITNISQNCLVSGLHLHPHLPQMAQFLLLSHTTGHEVISYVAGNYTVLSGHFHFQRLMGFAVMQVCSITITLLMLSADKCETFCMNQRRIQPSNNNEIFYTLGFHSNNLCGDGLVDIVLGEAERGTCACCPPHHHPPHHFHRVGKRQRSTTACELRESHRHLHDGMIQIFIDIFHANPSRSSKELTVKQTKDKQTFPNVS